jgi:HAE1 family hydrophobic/amphiphilic exporter-1
VDHYQIERVIDVYVSPSGEDLGGLANARRSASSPHRTIPDNLRVTMRGSVEGMRSSFSSFGIGLISR